MALIQFSVADQGAPRSSVSRRIRTEFTRPYRVATVEAHHPADCDREVDSSIGLGTRHHAGPVYEKPVYLPRMHPIYPKAPSVNPWRRGKSYFPERLSSPPGRIAGWKGCCPQKCGRTPSEAPAPEQGGSPEPGAFLGPNP